MMKFDLKNIASFGVAGNFTGHLEQAGEAADFVNVKTKEANAPKAVFPTYIPNGKENVPDYLKIFPFDSKKIIYPVGQTKLQIEPECAVLFSAVWENDEVKELKPLGFCASNDCSIRREGAKKISMKKNWGECSKGVSDNIIEISSFDENSVINDYRIASFLVRDKKVFAYGEDSAIKDYSYVYKKLTDWLIEKFNTQKDEGPAENINSYLISADKPEKILVSIGATRYTDYGKENFLANGDHSIVVLYPASKYSYEDIVKMVSENNLDDKDISVLDQIVVNNED
ncbi:MAG: DUF5718 family protein [Ruminococcus callidus]|nr:DUF5718 family protein [Ruminococcus callidus]